MLLIKILILILKGVISRMDADGSHMFVKLSSFFKKKRNENVTEEDILNLVDDSTERGLFEESEREMINNVFEFGDRDAGDIMTHRTDIAAVDVNDNIQDIINIAIEQGFSRIPVYQDDIDNIIGIIYVKDLLTLIGCNDLDSRNLSDFIRKAIYIPESTKCNDLFAKFTEHKLHMAIVVDEYGGTSGIVTMEDIIESVFGNIQDEYDNEGEEFSVIDENTMTIDGSADLDDVSKALHIDLEKGDEYDTLGGLITDRLGRIPGQNEHPEFVLGDYRFTVLVVEDRRIIKVKAERITENIASE